MSKILYLHQDKEKNEILIALTENGTLVELTRENREKKFVVGDIYVAKVKKILPSLNAAFVDLGYKKDAFLHYSDLGPNFLTFKKYLNVVLTSSRPVHVKDIKQEKMLPKDGNIKDFLSPGQKIIVQVTKEPISTKGPRITTEITIPGRHLVLLPFSDKISVSQKIKNNEEKQRLKSIMSAIVEKNYGVIVRTNAENKTTSDFDKELRSLIKKWENAFVKVNNKTKFPIKVLGEENKVSTIIRDVLNDSFTSIFVDDASLYNDVKEHIAKFIPEKLNILNYYSGKEDMFEKYGIEKQINNSFGRVVNLKTGAYLIIEQTEALTSIDVNSGNRNISNQSQETNALEVNMLAAEEIAKQLRLRDIGGLIVVDFIDMYLQENKDKVYEKMKDLLEKDKAKTSVLPLSKFNLMEITRQRRRPATAYEVSEVCPVCRGTGKVTKTIYIIDEIEKNLAYVSEKYNMYKKIVIETHPFISAYLTKGLFSVKRKWQKKYKMRIKITPNKSYSLLEYHFFDTYGNDIF
jgi:ribonuclease G